MIYWPKHSRLHWVALTFPAQWSWGCNALWVQSLSLRDETIKTAISLHLQSQNDVHTRDDLRPKGEVIGEDLLRLLLLLRSSFLYLFCLIFTLCQVESGRFFYSSRWWKDDHFHLIRFSFHSVSFVFRYQLTRLSLLSSFKVGGLSVGFPSETRGGGTTQPDLWPLSRPLSPLAVPYTVLSFSQSSRHHNIQSDLSKMLVLGGKIPQFLIFRPFRMKSHIDRCRSQTSLLQNNREPWAQIHSMKQENGNLHVGKKIQLFG